MAKSYVAAKRRELVTRRSPGLEMMAMESRHLPSGDCGGDATRPTRHLKEIGGRALPKVHQGRMLRGRTQPATLDHRGDSTATREHAAQEPAEEHQHVQIYSAGSQILF